MKTRTMVVFALGLALAAGCKKKEKDNKGTTPPTGSGSSTAVAKPTEGSGSAVAKPVEPPKPAPKTGKDLAQAFIDCGGIMNSGKWDDFAKQCIADGFVAHHADE